MRTEPDQTHQLLLRTLSRVLNYHMITATKKLTEIRHMHTTRRTKEKTKDRNKLKDKSTSIFNSSFPRKNKEE